MPFTLLSHQGPLIIFKKTNTKYITPFWLILGTIIPDLELPMRHSIHNIGPYSFYWGHSIFGQFFWTVPLCFSLSLVLLIIMNRFECFYSGNNYLKIIIDDLELNENISKRLLISIIISSFLGGMTHALLDSFTHNQSLLFYPLFIINFDFPVYFTVYFIDTLYQITILDILWYILSFVLGTITLIFLYRYLKNLHKQIKGQI